MKICTISIKLSYFLKDCNVAKLKPLYEKGTKTDRNYIRLVSILTFWLVSILSLQYS